MASRTRARASRARSAAARRRLGLQLHAVAHADPADRCSAAKRAALTASHALLERACGCRRSARRPCRPGTSRLRVTFSAAHTDADVAQLVEALQRRACAQACRVSAPARRDPSARARRRAAARLGAARRHVGPVARRARRARAPARRRPAGPRPQRVARRDHGCPRTRRGTCCPQCHAAPRCSAGRSAGWSRWNWRAGTRGRSAALVLIATTPRFVAGARLGSTACAMTCSTASRADSPGDYRAHGAQFPRAADPR